MFILRQFPLTSRRAPKLSCFVVSSKQSRSLCSFTLQSSDRQIVFSAKLKHNRRKDIWTVWLTLTSRGRRKAHLAVSVWLPTKQPRTYISTYYFSFQSHLLHRKCRITPTLYLSQRSHRDTANLFLDCRQPAKLICKVGACTPFL